MKTIFIIVTRGFIVRNILRSGVLSHLKAAGLRVVIFFPNKGEEVPDALRKEFEDTQVAVEGVPDVHLPYYSFFSKWVGFLVYTQSTRAYSLIGNMANLRRARFWKHLESSFFFLVSKIPFLKSCARFIDARFFTTHAYDSYFETYKPSLVFSTSIISKLDILMMKAARERGVKTVSMPKGWDNITKMLYRFVPDRLLVQNEIMKKRAVEVQEIDPGQIVVTGFPQFDWYRQSDIILSREEYFRKIGADPKRKLIFFGSEGIWAPDDDKVLDSLVVAINTPGTFTEDVAIFIRPHFTDAPKGRFNRFKGLPNVIVDENFTFSDFFMDNWDPGIEETKLFTNLIYHCDVLVTVASTLTLDGVSTDRPLVNVAYTVLRHPGTGEDLSSFLYETEHYQWVLETDALDVVRSDEELISTVNAYFKDPSRKRHERELLLERLCYKVDGNSSKRVADAILELL